MLCGYWYHLSAWAGRELPVSAGQELPKQLPPVSKRWLSGFEYHPLPEPGQLLPVSAEQGSPVQLPEQEPEFRD